jgi:hypothetical protein
MGKQNCPLPRMFMCEGGRSWHYDLTNATRTSIDVPCVVVRWSGGCVTWPRRGEAGVGGGDASVSLLGAEVGGDAATSL